MGGNCSRQTTEQWFYRHFIRDRSGWSLSQFNSKAFMATCTPCRKGSCESVQNLWSSRWWKEAYDQVLCKWQMGLNAGNEEPYSNIWYYQVLLRLKKKWLENECIVWHMSQQLLFSLPIGWLNVFTLLQALFCDGRDNDTIFATFFGNWARSSVTKKGGWEAPGGRSQAQELKQFALHFPHSPFMPGFLLRIKQIDLHNLLTAQWRPHCADLAHYHFTCV